MIHDDAFILVLLAGAMFAYGVWCAAVEVEAWWQRWERRKMTRWQRRVAAGDECRTGLGVRVATTLPATETLRGGLPGCR